jgi:hypothetical protein
MGVVARDAPMTERDPERSRRSLYRLADPYLSFWMSSIRPLRSAGLAATASPALLWDTHVSTSLDDSMGHPFEMACRAYLTLHRALPAPRSVGRWWNADNSLEIDAVALSAKDLYVAECKWGRVDSSDLGGLRRSTAGLKAEIGWTGPVHEILISGRGEFSDAVRQRAVAEGVTLLGPEELFDLDSPIFGS